MSAIETVEPKRFLGQFFTTTNPFHVDIFHKWLKGIPDYKTVPVIEPFAGANNIVEMIADIGHRLKWTCFDSEPVNDESNSSGVVVQVADSLKNYPTGFQIAITNPPYLASYSAKRLGIPFPKSKHDNVYKEALDVMLAATPYVAAIIPESFITQNLFHCRLQAVISLASRMFEDTETPVCLALFVPEVVKPEPTNFAIYKDNILLGTYSKLKKALAPYQGEGLDWKFNENDGLIGLRAIDSQRGPSIRFLPGEEITCPMKVSTRLLTRIRGPVTAEQAKQVIQVANELLESRRKRTKDTFMTAFKGLRDDGSYRRRLDYTQARDLLNLAAQKVGLLS